MTAVDILERASDPAVARHHRLPAQTHLSRGGDCQSESIFVCSTDLGCEDAESLHLQQVQVSRWHLQKNGFQNKRHVCELNWPTLSVSSFDWCNWCKTQGVKMRVKSYGLI